MFPVWWHLVFLNVHGCFLPLLFVLAIVCSLSCPDQSHFQQGANIKVLGSGPKTLDQVMWYLGLYILTERIHTARSCILYGCRWMSAESVHIWYNWRERTVYMYMCFSSLVEFLHLLVIHEVKFNWITNRRMKAKPWLNFISARWIQSILLMNRFFTHRFYFSEILHNASDTGPFSFSTAVINIITSLGHCRFICKASNGLIQHTASQAFDPCAMTSIELGLAAQWDYVTFQMARDTFWSKC